MKVLLDEQLSKTLKPVLLGDFDVFTQKELGWLGYQNGVLRENLNENNFSFLITADKNLPFQQNLKLTDFTILLLDTPRLGKRFQQDFVSKILSVLDNPPNPLPKLIVLKHDIWQNERLIVKLKKRFLDDDILFV